jgi:CRP-like cAMP-binding protein
MLGAVADSAADLAPVQAHRHADRLPNPYYGSVPTDEQVQYLGRVPLFADLDPEALDRVAACSAEIAFPAGAILIERGHPGSGMFIILEGRVAVELASMTAELGPGEFVGELSLLTDDPLRTGRVTALTDVRCVCVGRAELVEILHAEPSVALAMLSTLARRLHDVAWRGAS